MSPAAALAAPLSRRRREGQLEVGGTVFSASAKVFFLSQPNIYAPECDSLDKLSRRLPLWQGLRAQRAFSGADLTFATNWAADSRSECQIQSSPSTNTC